VKTVGIVAVAIVTVFVVGGAVVGVRSIPDIQRYRKIRRM